MFVSDIFPNGHTLINLMPWFSLAYNIISFLLVQYVFFLPHVSLGHVTTVDFHRFMILFISHITWCSMLNLVIETGETGTENAITMILRGLTLLLNK